MDIKKQLERKIQKHDLLKDIDIQVTVQKTPLYSAKQLNKFAKEKSMPPEYSEGPDLKFSSGMIERTKKIRKVPPKLPGGNKNTHISHLFPNIAGGEEKRANLVHLHKQVNTVLMKGVENFAMKSKSPTYFATQATQFKHGRPEVIHYDIVRAKGKSISIRLSKLNTPFKKK